MTPRQLKYFLRITELRSFTKAAAVLHIAQPALSRQIQQLEADLGVQLFVRSDTGVTLTEAGEVLAGRAAQLLEQLAAVRDEVSAVSGLAHGSLQIGIPPSLFHLVTMPAILDYRKLHSAVSLCVVEGISSLVYELLLGGRLDVGIVLSFESMQGLQQRRLFSEKVFLAGAPGFIEPVAETVSLQSAAEYPLILTQRPNAMRLLFEEALRDVGLRCSSVLEANSTRVQSAMAAAGMGCVVLPYSAIADDVRAGRLIAVPIESLQVTWTLVYSRERTLSIAAQRLVDLMLDVAVRQAEAGTWPGFVLAPQSK